MARKKQSTKKTNSQINVFPIRFKTLLKDERFRFILSMVFLFSAAVMTLAFLSYLFTWKVDQSKFDLGIGEYLFNSDVTVENWTGKAGALLARIFIHNWFGLPSFAFIYLFILMGFKLLNIKTYSLKKSLKYCMFGIIWLSITLSFIFGDSLFYLGGSFGFILNNWFVSLLGRTGTAFLLLIAAFTFIIFTFENSFDWMKAFFKNFVRDKKLTKAYHVANDKLSDLKENPKESKSKFFDKFKKKEASKVEKLNDDYEDINEDKNSPKKNVPIDLDTNEPLRVVESQKYILKDDGKKVDDELGFEVEKTTQKEEIFNSAEKLDDKINNRHALEVEKNKDITAEKVGKLDDYDPKLDLASYNVPGLDLLANHESGNSEVTNDELISNKNKIVETLANYKIEITKIKATIGPTITLYEIIPAPGVRISKIKNLEDDIALSLAALGIRIIAPMPGRGTIGIEVPNQKPEIVSMRSVISSSKFQESKAEIPIAIGKTISNESFVLDLTKMPHLLVAGATGQGKSVGLNAIIASVLYKKHPAQVKFVLVDPKKVELTLYEKIENHFLAKLPDMEEPIITDNQKVISTLNSLNVEMDNRYNLLKEAHCRNIKEYNTKFISRRLNPEKGHRYLPYIILVIDEFADLIMTAGKEVELPIARLAQLARAIGIHLIVATQRPSTNIITGVIKANFPNRMAFKVASMVDSRTILDSPGANQLIGRGDMLITQGSDLIRLQCAFIDTPELERITDFITAQRGYPSAHLLPEPDIDSDTAAGEVDLSQRDKLFEDAARIVVMNQQGSTSLIQRKLSIGYNRAGRIIDQLEAAGIVGPFEGSKARQVLFQDEYSLESFLNTLD